MPAELVLAEPALGRATAPITQVRSTLLAASLAALRGAGLWDRYHAQASPALREGVAALVSGTWIAVDFALTHYRTMEAMEISPVDMRAISAQIAIQLQTSVLSSLLVLAKAAQVTPWLPLEQSPRLSARIWNGGGIQLWRLGPKEARMVFVGNVLMTVPLVHDAMATTLTVLLDAFATKVYVRTEEHARGDNKCSLRIAWA